MYTKEERLVIGRRIYDGEISRAQAADDYGISPNSARDYMRLYRDTNHLPPKNKKRPVLDVNHISGTSEAHNLTDYEAMSKEELIQELVRSRITQARLKKGYEVKGDGPNKEFIPLDSKNTR